MLKDNQLLDALNHESILVGNLLRGDIAKVHNRWIFIIGVKQGVPGDNHGCNFEITPHGGGTLWENPNLSVPYIPSNYINPAAKLKLLAEHHIEQKKIKEAKKAEDREERARYQKMLEHARRELQYLDSKEEPEEYERMQQIAWAAERELDCIGDDDELYVINDEEDYD